MVSIPPLANQNDDAQIDQSKNNEQAEAARQYWDGEAAAFDDAPDHGLHNPHSRDAWVDLIRKAIPPTRSKILDIGCGTGSISLVLAQLGHDVTGIDISPAMIALAQAKAQQAKARITFHVMDAAFPQFSSDGRFAQHRFNVILCRHLLWTLPEPATVLQRWADLLTPKGQLHLIEGFWHTGAGLHADHLARLLPSSFTNVVIHPLSEQGELWGSVVSDERYMISAIVA